MEITGKCHCGRLTYEVSLPFEGDSIPVRRCSCTFCRKHGAVYTSHPAGSLRATIRGGAGPSGYSFATGTAEFHVCPTCGVVPFVTSEIDNSLRAVVNVNTLEGIDPSHFAETTTNFDGEDTETRLARRLRNWIPSVSITYDHK